MSKSQTSRSRGSIPGENTGTLGMADMLCLAAAPTFAVMALVSALDGDAAMTCMGTPLTTLPLTGMTVMYLLMSAFHLAPWLRVISGRQVQAGRN
ncbi:hypothetical protein [Mesorhizobium sp. INR15]|uniref:hypothetical protein n=1 Tax=Mesorhizobium sp. INR15 TaxID=2654248 RepID=UPI0018965CA2|nr:hypothetical protein [Mesorhizobium sp. INR15]QPC91990.1 hypothetical protein GA829_16125 [Mesorhizobium sp. INR15]